LVAAVSASAVILAASPAARAEAPLVLAKGKVFAWVGGAISLPTHTYFNDFGQIARDSLGREVSLTLYGLGLMLGVSDEISLLLQIPVHTYRLSVPAGDPPAVKTRYYSQMEMVCISGRYKLPIKVFENVLELRIGAPTGTGQRFYEQEAFTVTANYLARIEFAKKMFAQGFIGIDLVSKYSTHNVGWNAELGYMPTRYFNFGLGLGGVYPLGAITGQNPFDGLPSGQGSIYVQPFIYSDPAGGLEIRFAFDYMLLGWNQFFMNMFELTVSYRF
jgi:hypothetical protein